MFCRERRKNNDRLDPKILGEGSFGRVYGPYGIQEVRLFLSRSDPTSTTYIKENLEECGQYVIKIIFREERMDKQRSEAMGRIFERCQRDRTARWIAPLVVGRITRSNLTALIPFKNNKNCSFLFEIQRYAGGDDMFDVVVNSKKSVQWSIHNLVTLWTSMIEILEIGVTLIDAGYLLSDIKMENMIVDESGIWMIDPEIYPQHIFTRMKNMIITPSPMNMPAQFLNQHFFSPNPLRKHKQVYRRNWNRFKKFYQDINNYHLETLFQMTSKASRYQNPALFIRRIAILGLFYPFMMIMIYVIDTRICIEKLSPESQNVVENIIDLCYHIIQSRAASNSPKTMLTMMKRAIKSDKSLVSSFKIQDHTIHQDYCTTTTPS